MNWVDPSGLYKNHTIYIIIGHSLDVKNQALDLINADDGPNAPAYVIGIGCHGKSNSADINAYLRQNGIKVPDAASGQNPATKEMLPILPFYVRNMFSADKIDRKTLNELNAEQQKNSGGFKKPFNISDYNDTLWPSNPQTKEEFVRMNKITLESLFKSIKTIACKCIEVDKWPQVNIEIIHVSGPITINDLKNNIQMFHSDEYIEFKWTGKKTGCFRKKDCHWMLWIGGNKRWGDVKPPSPPQSPSSP